MIVNAAIGGHYHVGQRRLGASLDAMGYTGKRLMLRDWGPSAPWHATSVYTIKAVAMEQAMKEGGIIIWMDCTAVVVQPLDALYDRIRERGYYLASSGYSAAQTCTDRQMEAAGVSRDEVIPDAATGCVGIDLDNATGASFLYEWIGWAKRGLFAGSRGHNPEDSKDPRFLFGRQDQSVATLIAHKLGMTLDHLGGLTAYWNDRTPTTVMAYKGIQ